MMNIYKLIIQHMRSTDDMYRIVGIISNRYIPAILPQHVWFVHDTQHVAYYRTRYQII